MSGNADNLVLKGEMYKENADISEQHHLYLNWMRCMILADKEYGVMGEHERPWVYNELKVFFLHYKQWIYKKYKNLYEVGLLNTVDMV